MSNWYDSPLWDEKKPEAKPEEEIDPKKPAMKINEESLI